MKIAKNMLLSYVFIYWTYKDLGRPMTHCGWCITETLNPNSVSSNNVMHVLNVLRVAL